MRGRITQLLGEDGWGFIRGEDGCEVFFDGFDIRRKQFITLKVGDAVEYDLRFARHRLHPLNVIALRQSPRKETDVHPDQHRWRETMLADSSHDGDT